jgi:hypothetical protein
MVWLLALRRFYALVLICATCMALRLGWPRMGQYGTWSTVVALVPGEVLTRDRTTGTEGSDAQYVLAEQSGPRLAAYAYAHTKSPAFAKKAIEGVVQRGGGYANPKLLTGPDVLNPAEEALEVNTNAARLKSG